jgi:hypothetical protein
LYQISFYLPHFSRVPFPKADAGDFCVYIPTPDSLANSTASYIMTAIPKLRYSNWVKQVFHQRSIRQKIFFGYGLALGIAVLGTIAGLVIGDRYLQQARKTY